MNKHPHILLSLLVLLYPSCEPEQLEPSGIAPAAAFTVSTASINVGQSVQFSDVSTNSPTSWNWDFGDGGTSTLQNPSHIYSIIGTFTVSLTATNNFGTDSEIKNSYITVSEMTSGTFTDDRDKHDYRWIKIGNQKWMAENLAYLPWVSGPVGSENINYYVSGYNGTDINAAKGTENYHTYGVLYNMAAALNGQDTSSTNPSGIQGVCPSGWHLPSSAEWTELIDFLGTDTLAGGSMKERGTNHWAFPNTGASNESGFTALPGGYMSGGFNDILLKSLWWSSKGRPLSGADTYGNYYKSNDVILWNVDSTFGVSVRCVGD